MTDLWSAIGAGSAAIGTVVVSLAAIYAYMQVREAKASRTLGAMITIYEQYQSLDSRLARATLYSGDDLLTEFSDEELEPIRRLLSQLELLGILVEHKLLDFELVANVFDDVPIMWKLLEPYILDRREKRKNPRRAIYFELLAQRYAEREPGPPS
jgi:hypothetical protein